MIADWVRIETSPVALMRQLVKEGTRALAARFER